MTRRSVILGIFAAILLAIDSRMVYEHYYRVNAALTYIGLDSVVEIVPASLRAAEYHSGSWDSDPTKALHSRYNEPPAGQPAKPIAFVGLGPRAQFGKAIQIIRDLKARKICHVVIRESGFLSPVAIDFGKGPEKSLAIPVIVLCGYPYGDGSAFDGKLPPDRLLHVGNAFQD